MLAPHLRVRVLALATVSAVAFGLACAQPGTPPGGPPDTEVPLLLKVLPDSNAVNVRAPAVVLQFDEVINERSSAPGVPPTSRGSTLSTVLLLSPSDGRDEVVWRRTVLELRPRRGFRPNTTYSVTVMPGLADLRGNRSELPFGFVFSTGPRISEGTLRGVIFDWNTGKVAAKARVEMFRPTDSTFRWSTYTDSSGRFVLKHLVAGEYELRAWVDANNDGRISFREISDSTRISLVDSVSLELYAYGRDTLPPRIEAVELIDSTGISLRFDRGIVPSWDGRGATLLRADSTPVTLGGVFMPSTRFDSLAKIAADSTAGDAVRADTVRRETRRPDSLPALPVFTRELPIASWSVPLAAPLAPGIYRLRIKGPRGLNGRAVDAEREIRVREPSKAPTPPTTLPDSALVAPRRPPAEAGRRRP